MDTSNNADLAAILPRFTQWYRNRQGQLTAAGVTSTLRTSPPEWRKASISLSMDSGTRLSQLTVWNSGETELHLADINTGTHTPQHHVISTPDELDDLLNQQLTWLRHQPRPT